MTRTRTFRSIATVAVAVVFTLIAWPALSANILGGWQLRFSDALYPGTGTDPRIAVVGIDDESLSSADAEWPWPRDMHGVIMENLAEAGAGLIVYDIVFSPGTEQDEALARSLERAGNVVLAGFASFPEGRPTGEVLRAQTFTGAEPPLERAAAGIGHANVIPDSDNVRRALPLVIDVEGELLPSLSLQAFAAMSGASGPLTLRPGQGLQLGGTLIAAEERQIMNVNFSPELDDRSMDAPLLSAWDVYEGNFDRSDVAGRTVLVGVTDPTLGDNQPTPVSKAQEMPGVFIHANALNTMLQGAYIEPAGLSANLLAVFLITLAVALAVQFLPLTIAALTPFVLGAAYLMFVFNRFDGGTVFNMVYPNVGIVVGFVGSLGVRYFTELRERRRVTSTFGRYLAKDVVDEVLAAPEGAVATLKGALRPLSVLFADLRGFTAASENAQPTEVVEALNVYLDAMTRAVVEEKGTIDKFMGDCVMAFWGAPRPDPQYVDRAVRAGIKMLDYIDQAVAENPAARSLMVKGCGVGISAGMAVVGNIGSQERLDYTAIGDTVNTASRLCGVAESGMVVVTDDTAAFLSEEFRVAPLPPLMVKGKSAPLEVFQVLREGQEAKAFEAGQTMDATEDKGHFEAAPEQEPVAEAEPVTAPAKAAGYAPIEPVSPPDGGNRS